MKLQKQKPLPNSLWICRDCGLVDNPVKISKSRALYNRAVGSLLGYYPSQGVAHRVHSRLDNPSLRYGLPTYPQARRLWKGDDDEELFPVINSFRLDFYLSELLTFG